MSLRSEIRRSTPEFRAGLPISRYLDMNTFSFQVTNIGLVTIKLDEVDIKLTFPEYTAHSLYQAFCRILSSLQQHNGQLTFELLSTHMKDVHGCFLDEQQIDDKIGQINQFLHCQLENNLIREKLKIVTEQGSNGLLVYRLLATLNAKR